MSKKLLAAVGGVAATVALAVPAQSHAQSGQLLKLQTQLLQPNSGCFIIGTNGSFLLGAPLRICI